MSVREAIKTFLLFTLSKKGLKNPNTYYTSINLEPD